MSRFLASGFLVLVAVLQSTSTACSVVAAEAPDILTAWTAPRSSSQRGPSPLLRYESRRLFATAATLDRTLAPWQREFMLGMALEGSVMSGGGELKKSTPTVLGTLSGTDGTWLADPPPSTREVHSAIY